MSNIEEKLMKEKEALKELLNRKEKLDSKIRDKNQNIEKLNLMLNQQKFSEVNQVLDSKGLSIEEVMSALQSGDLLSLQNKFKSNESITGS